jgi:transporter family-2 protein
MRAYPVLAAWTFLAGAGIPMIGVLNGGIARAVGNPFAATLVMFAVAVVAAAGITLPLYGLPDLSRLAAAPVASYGAGLIIGFYALSATIIIPRMGAASFVAFILIAQLVTSALIDQFGIFGVPRRPVDLVRLSGLLTIVAGIVIMEIGNLKAARS